MEVFYLRENIYVDEFIYKVRNEIRDEITFQEILVTMEPLLSSHLLVSKCL